MMLSAIGAIGGRSIPLPADQRRREALQSRRKSPASSLRADLGPVVRPEAKPAHPKSAKSVFSTGHRIGAKPGDWRERQQKAIPT